MEDEGLVSVLVLELLDDLVVDGVVLRTESYGRIETIDCCHPLVWLTAPQESVKLKADLGNI